MSKLIKICLFFLLVATNVSATDWYVKTREAGTYGAEKWQKLELTTDFFKEIVLPELSHSDLDDLDYASSGHTGFLASTGGTATGDYFFNGKFELTTTPSGTSWGFNVLSSTTSGNAGVMRVVHTRGANAGAGAIAYGTFFSSQNNSTVSNAVFTGSYIASLNHAASISTGLNGLYVATTDSNSATSRFSYGIVSRLSVAAGAKTASTDLEAAPSVVSFKDLAGGNHTGAYNSAAFYGFTHFPSVITADQWHTIYGGVLESPSYVEAYDSPSYGILFVSTTTSGYEPKIGAYFVITASDAGAANVNRSGVFGGSAVRVGTATNPTFNSDTYEDGDMQITGDVQVKGNLYCDNLVANTTTTLTKATTTFTLGAGLGCSTEAPNQIAIDEDVDSVMIMAVRFYQVGTVLLNNPMTVNVYGDDDDDFPVAKTFTGNPTVYSVDTVVDTDTITVADINAANVFIGQKVYMEDSGYNQVRLISGNSITFMRTFSDAPEAGDYIAPVIECDTPFIVKTEDGFVNISFNANTVVGTGDDMAKAEIVYMPIVLE